MQQSGTLGFMLQGVSQQPQRVQPDGHVEEQINWLSDPNSGLTTRPGSTLISEFPAVPENAYTETVRIGEDDYLVICDEGSVRVFDYSSGELTVNDPEGISGYVGRNMAIYAADDEIILVNKDSVVQRDATTDDDDVIRNWGYAYHLGGEFGKTYRLVLTYEDATVVEVEYTTPFGENSGDAERTSADFIIREIYDAVLAHPNFKSSTSVTLAEDTISILDDTTTFTLIAFDGAQNALFRAGVGTAETFADLPRFAIEGAVIRVRGRATTIEDDVWVRFDADGFDTLGEGFGSKGVWKETADPDDLFMYDLNTMPHVLVVDLDNQEVELNYGNWSRRRTGNASASPIPSFVGLKISDVGEFSNRLWFLAGPNFIASRTDNLTDFFRQTALQILDTDPVDIRSTGEDKSGLVFGVAYDRNLLLFSEMGQFSIAGGSSFTTGNASMLRSTNFEMSSGVRPVVAGSTVLMPYKNRIYSGLNELKPSLELDSNAVEDLSKVTKKFIRGTVELLVASGNSNTALMVTDADKTTMYVYNFLWEDTRKVQSAFHEWRLPLPVKALHIREGKFFVWLASTGKSYLCELLPDRPEDFNLVYNALMDLKQSINLIDKKVVLDFDNMRFIANTSNADYPVGIEVTPKSVTEVSGGFEYEFENVAPDNLVTGVPFVGKVVPNRPVYVDWRGARVPSARVVVGKYVVDYDFSGGISASMQSIYRGNFLVATNDQFPTDDDPTTDFGQSLSTGSFDVPWGDDNFNSKLIIETSTLQPVTIVEIRWWGQLFRGKN